jgi:hypothetical protein
MSLGDSLPTKERQAFLCTASITLYVCTFGKEGSGKGHHVVSRRKETLETREVSDASTYGMLG